MWVTYTDIEVMKFKREIKIKEFFETYKCNIRYSLIEYVIEHQDNQNEKLEQIVKSPLPVISPRTTIEEMSGIIDQNNPAMLVKKSDGTFGIITTPANAV